MAFTLPELPYPYDALAPSMSRETLEFHHDKHHAAYVTNGNNLAKGTEWENKPVEDVVKGTFGKNAGLFNNAAQHYNHIHFWKWMKKGGGGDKIPGKLENSKTPNGENPLVHGASPILGCDVWEHSYYIDYRNRRPDYLKAFFESLINWDHVAEMYEAATKEAPSRPCALGSGASRPAFCNRNYPGALPFCRIVPIANGPHLLRFAALRAFETGPVVHQPAAKSIPLSSGAITVARP